MITKVFSVLEAATIEEAVESMRYHQFNRLLVKNDKGKITGILSLGHLVRNVEPSEVAEIVKHMIGKSAACRLLFKVVFEPCCREFGNLLQRALLFKEVRSAGNDVQMRFVVEFS